MSDEPAREPSGATRSGALGALVALVVAVGLYARAPEPAETTGATAGAGGVEPSAGAGGAGWEERGAGERGAGERSGGAPRAALLPGVLSPPPLAPGELYEPPSPSAPATPPRPPAAGRWAPDERPEGLAARGVLGQRPAWLRAAAEARGWRAQEGAFELTRPLSLPPPLSGDIRVSLSAGAWGEAGEESDMSALRDALVAFDEGATAADASLVWALLLGDEELALGAPRAERPDLGWRWRADVRLPSGRHARVELVGRASGAPPYGPASVSVQLLSSP